MVAYPEFLWMPIMGSIFAFAMAFGIGANDVANAFASSIAAKSLTLLQANIIAAVFEFLGAFLLGATVTNTVRSGIVNASFYEDEPTILMFGMLVAVLTAAIWLVSATALEFPVSTTHTIIASIIGFSLSAKGFPSVDWFKTGMVFVSWIASPVLSGALSAFFFSLVKYLVLRAPAPYPRAIASYPIVLFIAITLNMYFVMEKAGAQVAKIEDYEKKVVLPVTLGSAALCTLIYLLFIGPYLKRKIQREQDDHDAALEAEVVEAERIAVMTDEEKLKEAAAGDSESIETKDSQHDEVTATEKKSNGFGSRVTKSVNKSLNKLADNTYRQDLEAQSRHESHRAAEIMDAAEVFDPRSEKLFSYLQVFTAILDSFAHGSNDVANAVAPLSAILVIYNTGEITSKSPVYKWVLALGGFGLVMGLWLYGYKIMKAVGFKLTKISPSRGFTIELSTSFIVLIASFIGIPVSSTQCQVGATTGVGMVGGMKNVQWLYLLRVMFGWVFAFFGVVITAAGIMAFCVYSPSLVPS